MCSVHDQEEVHSRRASDPHFTIPSAHLPCPLIAARATRSPDVGSSGGANIDSRRREGQRPARSASSIITIFTSLRLTLHRPHGLPTARKRRRLARRNDAQKGEVRQRQLQTCKRFSVQASPADSQSACSTANDTLQSEEQTPNLRNYQTPPASHTASRRAGYV